MVLFLHITECNFFRLMAPIFEKATKAIESVGKEGSYTLVQALDPQQTFYYSSPAEDITPLVKTKLGLK